MRKSNHNAIRAALRLCQDGATTTELSMRLGIERGAVYRALKNMPDTFIDRWDEEPGARGQYLAIWCLTPTPEDCPHPTRKEKVK